ncbi:MAG: DUF2971 domain-containing protein [Gammaproteobacteria bacterium]|nr:DUF2971 domain-containing protein [Gammaproteobacteria bacterium]
MNDTEELTHGLRAIGELLTEEKNQTTKDLIKKMLSDEYDPNIYSFSLSEDEDSLYQWLSYSPKEGGIALGFECPTFSIPMRPKSFCDHFSLPLIEISGSQMPRYDKCNYFINDNDIKDEWIKPRRDKNMEVNLLLNAMFLKHGAFHFEREHRIFFHPLKNSIYYVPPKFNGNKPYIEFHFEPLILRKVFVSPRVNKNLTKRTVNKILSTRTDLSHVEVSVSEIPFRD